MYDKSLQLKHEKQAREMQEELAFDLKILEQLLEESKNEAREHAQRKVCAGNKNHVVCTSHYYVHRLPADLINQEPSSTYVMSETVVIVL